MADKREAPNRSRGEGESRLHSAMIGGLIKPEQLYQATNPRGYASDIEGRYLQPLNAAEYFNRKMKLLSSDDVPEVFTVKAEDIVNLPRFIIPDTKPFFFKDCEERFDRTELRLPYQSMVFELGEAGHLIMAGNPSPEQITLWEIDKNDPEHPFKMVSKVMVSKKKGVAGGLTVVEMPVGHYVESEWSADRFDYAKVIMGFIDEFMEGNTVITTLGKVNPDKPPPVRNGIAKRIVRVVTGVTTVRRPWQGGTHASPREHERQGHYRRCRDGKRRWFGPVLVNPGVVGRVEKTYLVEKK